MFCFGLQSIVRFINQSINMNPSYFNTHRLESEGKFPETFVSQLEKNKNVIKFHRPRSVHIGRNCALGLSTALDLNGLKQYSRPRAQFLLIRTDLGR